MSQQNDTQVNIPSTWEIVRLKDISRKITDGSHSPPPKQNSGTPMLSAINIQSGLISFESIRYISDSDFQKEYSRANIETGDVLLTIVGSIGRTAVVKESHPKFAIQRSVALIKPFGVNSKYLSFSFENPIFQKQLAEKSKGTAQKGVYLKTLSELKVFLPPLAEQHRIIEKIEELFSDLDDGIASLKKAQQQLKVYRQAVLKWAFEGKLTAKWREEQKQQGKLESADTLLEQIKAEREQRYQGKYQEPVIPEFLASLQIPAEWSLVTLDQLSLLITSGSRGWAKYYSNSGDFFIRAQDINTDSLRLDQVAYVNPPKGSEGQRTSVQFGDLLITITGANVTKSALVNIDLKKAAYVNQHVGLVRLSKLVSPKFVYYWIVSPKNGRSQLTKSAYGAGKPGLNLTNLKEVIVALPSLQEQNQIVEEIESRLSICDSFDATITENLQRAEALRQSILKQAFEGKLVPQDPNDEPASVLLERIRTFKSAQAEGNKQTKRKQSL